jgi:hypothetical protein
MTIRRNAVLVALAAGGVLFIGLVIIARIPTLASLPIALAVGGTVLAALSRSASVPPIAPAPPVVLTPHPPPVQYQAQTIAGIPLPSAHEDYAFVFSATVYWLPVMTGISDPGMTAASEIIRRAQEITERRDPEQAVLVTHELATLLRDVRPDPAGRVQARAESVQLLLSPDDQRRLEELARLRKEEELWDYQRRHEQSKRRYLSADVLRNPGSAVVWWLARNDGQPEKVAESIGVLTQLARAANNTDDSPVGNATRATDEAAAAAPADPQTPAEHFGAFLDSLNSLDDDARLTLTKQMASLVEGHGYGAVAREMTGPYDEWPGGPDSGMPGDEPEPSDW